MIGPRDATDAHRDRARPAKTRARGKAAQIRSRRIQAARAPLADPARALRVQSAQAGVPGVFDPGFVRIQEENSPPLVIPVKTPLVIPVKTGNQEYVLDPGVRRGDEVRGVRRGDDIHEPRRDCRDPHGSRETILRGVEGFEPRCKIGSRHNLRHTQR